MLAVFGTANAKAIQAKVNEIVSDEKKIIRALAVSTIAGYTGKDTYRTKRLASWNTKVQSDINAIYSLKGKNAEAAAQYVIEGKFGTGQVRVLLLKFCGYNATTIQTKVNELLKKK
jgi:hypothetical protein